MFTVVGHEKLINYINDRNLTKKHGYALGVFHYYLLDEQTTVRRTLTS